jgi:spore maturation protein CgeB
VALCPVRHENRDRHSMRAFEVPAVGACMVTEDAVEHRRTFGGGWERVIYFKNPPEMVEKTEFLLKDSALRRKLRAAVHSWITEGNNTYANRLRTMLEIS